VSSTTTKSLFGFGLAAAAFVVYKMWNTKESLKFFQYSISGVKFRMNGFTPEIIFAVDVYNPNKTSIPVQAFFGNIKQGTNVIATFNNTNPITIGENTTQTISITAKVKAFSLVMAIINKQVNLHKVDLEAMVKTGFFAMPIKTTIDVLPGLAGTDDEIEGMGARRQMLWGKKKAMVKKFPKTAYKGFLFNRRRMSPGIAI